MTRGDLGNRGSRFDRMLQSGDNKASYMLGAALFVAFTLFSVFALGNIFDLWIFQDIVNGWNSLTEWQQGLVITTGMVAAIPIAVGAGKVINSVFLNPPNALENEKVSQLAKVDERTKDLGLIKDIRDSKLDGLAEEIKSCIIDTRSPQGTRSLIKKMVRDFAMNVDHTPDVKIVYNDLYPRLREFLEGEDAGRKEGLIDFFDVQRGLPERSRCLSVFDKSNFGDSALKAEVFINAMNECGFDYRKAVKNPAAVYDFHNTFGAALHQFSKKMQIEFDGATYPDWVGTKAIEETGLFGCKLENEDNYKNLYGTTDTQRKAAYNKLLEDGEKVEKVTYKLGEYQALVKEAVTKGIGKQYLRRTSALGAVLDQLEGKEELSKGALSHL